MANPDLERQVIEAIAAQLDGTKEQIAEEQGRAIAILRAADDPNDPNYAEAQQLLPELLSQLGLGGQEGGMRHIPIGEGLYAIDDPSTNRRYIINELTGDIEGAYSLAGEAEGSLNSYQKKAAAIPVLEQALGRRLSQDEAFRFLMGFAPGTGAQTGMTPYQAGQLGIQRGQLELSRQEALIQAARTGEPLSYLAMLRGGAPGVQPGGDVWQGIPRVVPTLADTEAFQSYTQPGAPGPMATPYERWQARRSPLDRWLERATLQGASPFAMGIAGPNARPAALPEAGPAQPSGPLPPGLTGLPQVGGGGLSADDIYQAAIAAGQSPQAAAVMASIAQAEGGLGGAVGDLAGGGSYGPFQLYAGGGQLLNFARDMGVSPEEAAQMIQANPMMSVNWVARPESYLSNAIQEGANRGLIGSALAAYAQQYGQRSAPGTYERAAQAYQSLFGGGLPLYQRQWTPPPAPGFIRSLQANEALKPVGPPTGVVRRPGVQAQARMSPYERAALRETVEFQGIPGMDWDQWLADIRSSFRPTLPVVAYAGRG